MTIAERLRARGLRPKKSLGQNFLLEPKIARAIAEAATTPPGGTVLEIGAGTGALTAPLTARAAHVTAIERDAELIPVLEEDPAIAAAIAEGKLTLVRGDALAIAWAPLLASGARPRVVAGNLPYLITGALLERVTRLAGEGAVDRAVLMVQAEVAARLIAPPGSEAYGALSVFVQAAFDVKRMLTVRGGAFLPKPDVDSSVVVLSPSLRAHETDAFRALVRAAFGARRKTLRNAYKGLFGWSRDELEARAAEASVSLDVRGETLAVEDFARLAALVKG